MRTPAFLLLCLATFFLAGCFASSEELADEAGKNRTIKVNGGGWDDFPNKYKPTLLDLSANVRRLPAPLGTQYASLYPTVPTGAKVAAPAVACTGDSTVLQYKSPVRDFFLYDTISYYDSNGVAHCSPPEGTRSMEKHVRRVVELGVGEAWETIQDSITDQDVLPRHNIRSTGLIRLESGREITIQSYDCTILTQFGTQDAYVIKASMTLLYKDGYVIHLDLAKSHPYNAAGFLPPEGPAYHGLIMSGPITHAAAASGIDTVGYIDLYGDRTIRVRDWTDAPVVP